MSAADVAKQSRQSQGLPERIEDPAALARIARLMAVESAQGVRDVPA